MILRELVLSYRPARDARDHPITCPSGPIRDPAAVVPLLMRLIASEPQEVVGALYVNTRHQMLGWRLLARGSLDAVVITPREVLQPGLLLNSKGLLLAHNHPSGSCEPSPEDIALTRRVKQAASLVALDVLDHVIIGSDGAWSSLQQLGFL
jgi:DNA repair protein RadC